MDLKDSIRVAAGTPRGRLAVRVAGGIVAAVAVFGLAGYFGGPPLLRYVIQKQAGEALGRKVTVADVKVRPFALAATVSGLIIFETDGRTPMVTVGEVEADTSVSSVWHLAPVVDALHVDRLSVHVVRDSAGKMNYDDIQQRIAAMPPKPPDAKPARFSVNNIAITESSFVYDDKLLNTSQRVEQFTLTLPFLSNLPHDTTIFTRPSLSARINGSPLVLDGAVLPFADTHETRLNVNLDGLEIPKYMPFAPRLRDAQVKGGLLDTRLAIGFRQEKDKQDLTISGTAALRDADIRTLGDVPLVKSGRVAVDIDRLEPLNNNAHLRSLEIDGLDIQAVRNPDGTLNLAGAFVPQPGKAGPKAEPAPAPASAPAAKPAQPPQPWHYAIDKILLKGARFGLTDQAAPSGPGKLALGPLDAEVNNLSGDSDKPAKVDAKLTIADGQTLHQTGDLSLRAGTLVGKLELQGIKPEGFSAWWPPQLKSGFGDTAINADLNYKLAWSGPTFQLGLEKSRLEFAPLHVVARGPVALSDQPEEVKQAIQARQQRLARRGASAAGSSSPATATTPAARAAADPEGANLPLLRADKVVLDDIDFDLGKQTLSAGELSLVKPQAAITRDYHGQLIDLARVWAAQSAQKEARGAQQRAAAANNAEPQGAAPAGGWKVHIGKTDLAGGLARLADYQVAAANRGRPVIHVYREIKVQTGAVDWPLKPGQLPVKLQAQTGKRGTVSLDGTVAPTTPSAQAQIDIRDVDVTLLQPYMSGQFNAALRSGLLSVKGKALVSAPAGKPPVVQFAGNVLAGNVRSVDRVTGDDFLRWRSLNLQGIRFDMDDAKGPMRVVLSNIALSDFYARVILNANGRLNLQDVMAAGSANGQPAPATSLTQATPASAPAAQPPAQPAKQAAAPGAPAGPAAPKGPTGPKPQIQIGGVVVDKGNINFSDFFVRPNYSANLTGMKGSVSKVSSGDPTPADLVLEGRLDDDAPVSISGKVNPLGEQLFLDIAAKASGVELTRLTPYAAKYAGYPITKGKLTVDVAYKIENGKLDARNHLYLDQLTFGDKVNSPDATKLPVLLAVSLLKDRNGVIDINLPVSGSLSDPEFSVGGVIVRVIVNLLAKAITSPFALIAHAFGGNAEELGYVEFAPGTSTLTPAAKQKVETVAKALVDRPALKLEISGRIDPKTDAPGARKAWLDARVAEQKTRDQKRAAQEGDESDSEGGEQGARVKVSAQEYPKYLEQVYKRADFKKPRNMVGLAKSLPPEEMEKLLLENAPVTDDDLKRLADARALTVKQVLERDGKIPGDRLFLTAPRLNADDIKDKGAPNRVDFAIRQ